MLTTKVKPSRVQVVQPAPKPQIDDGRFASPCVRDHVIELRQPPLAAASPIIGAKRALRLITNSSRATASGA
jgi:hypothetical protein